MYSVPTEQQSYFFQNFQLYSPEVDTTRFQQFIIVIVIMPVLQNVCEVDYEATSDYEWQMTWLEDRPVSVIDSLLSVKLVGVCTWWPASRP